MGRGQAGREARSRASWSMKTADLRFRGYSVTEQKDASTPERPRYVIGGVASRWRDLEGFHTRFGDVRELLQTVDDRYMIMNAGDELLLAFPGGAAAAAGIRARLRARRRRLGQGRRLQHRRVTNRAAAAHAPIADDTSRAPDASRTIPSTCGTAATSSGTTRATSRPTALRDALRAKIDRRTIRDPSKR